MADDAPPEGSVQRDLVTLYMNQYNTLATRLSDHVDYRNPDHMRWVETTQDFWHFCRIADSSRFFSRLAGHVLEASFDINYFQLPPDRLIPAIPNRFYYVSWIRSLVEETRLDFDTINPRHDLPLTGLDIGTGASLIYPLLFCKPNPNIKMIATEIDQQSYDAAQMNMSQNHLDDRVRLIKIEEESETLMDCLDASSTGHVDLTMCNPPFYDSAEQMAETAASRTDAPAGAFNIEPTIETVTEGGELAFANRIFTESLHHRTRVQWYSVLLSSLDHARTFAGTLEASRVSGTGIGTFAAAGMDLGQTARYLLAWSFVLRHPSLSAARAGALPPGLPLPPPPERTLPASRRPTIAALRTLATGHLMHTREPEPGVLLVLAHGITWTRAARRRAAKRAAAAAAAAGLPAPAGPPPSDAAATLVVRLTPNAVGLHVRLLQGGFGLFESFGGVLRRALDDGTL